MYRAATKKRRTILWLNVITAVAFWALYVWRLSQRIGFIITEGGMERRDGMGSPAAFLIGMAFEFLVMAVPAIVATVTAISLAKERSPTSH
jgi:hypothetical protein